LRCGEPTGKKMGRFPLTKSIPQFHPSTCDVIQIDCHSTEDEFPWV